MPVCPKMNAMVPRGVHGGIGTVFLVGIFRACGGKIRINALHVRVELSPPLPLGRETTIQFRRGGNTRVIVNYTVNSCHPSSSPVVSDTSSGGFWHGLLPGTSGTLKDPPQRPPAGAGPSSLPDFDASGQPSMVQAGHGALCRKQRVCNVRIPRNVAGG